MQAGAEDMENKLLPKQHGPPLHVADGSKGKAKLIRFGTSTVAGAARRVAELVIGLPTGPRLRIFCQGLLP